MENHDVVITKVTKNIQYVDLTLSEDEIEVTHISETSDIEEENLTKKHAVDHAVDHDSGIQIYFLFKNLKKHLLNH